MRLPNLDRAVVPSAKVTDYLLSISHRDGRHKAAFFLGYGFHLGDWQGLADALLEHARSHDVVKEESSPFGMRYVVEGKITSPDGRQPMLRSVWFIDADGEAPRFVTAYPLPGGP
jgi:hypothetical protein